ncbi:WD40 repeat-like protein [Artomyces pyxidatus]|uniref:WD40 repeat-like protein n=1 Tax=Artomyces pyxidatus TaxID=48021 RepID=A0ACB8TIQ6_9AGAM|nr:WD40 repeat-like protein [Artomyces pyxidatus]
MPPEVIDVDGLSDGDDIQYIGRATPPIRATGIRYTHVLSSDNEDTNHPQRQRLPSVGATVMRPSHPPTASTSRPQSIASASTAAVSARGDSRANPRVQSALASAHRKQQEMKRLAGSQDVRYPSAKRQRMAAPVPSSSTRKRPREEVIIINSDDEASPSPARKLMKREHVSQMRMPSPPPPYRPPVTEPDSEEEYQGMHAGLDMRHPQNWKPPPRPLSGAIDRELAVSMTRLSMTNTEQRPRPKRLQGALVEPPVRLPSLRSQRENSDEPNMSWLWEEFAKVARPLFPKPQMYLQHRASRVAHAPSPIIGTLSQNLGLNNLVLSTSFRQAGGPINKVAQSSGFIAISSATPGGHRDPTDEDEWTHDPQNRDGTLQIWKNGSARTLHGHKARLRLRNNRSYEKYYTVNDVKFDPNRPGWMASAGNDCTVRLWRNGEERSELDYSDAPHDLSYRPTDSLLAVTCLDGYVYIHRRSHDGFSPQCTSLAVAPADGAHCTGAMVWGCKASNDKIFASSEPKDSEEETGYHKVFDINRGELLYELDAKESGDAMAIDAEGERLALFTNGPGATHTLRMYDVRRDRRIAVQKITLEPFMLDASVSPDALGEVTTASFSPDGVLLAVARNDDELHVYDSRFLGRGPMGVYPHSGDDRCMGSDRYGVTEATWVEGWGGYGLGIVSGGADGCVRLWDVRRSDKDVRNGVVLAQTDFDVGHFSLGDPHKGEKPLVV